MKRTATIIAVAVLAFAGVAHADTATTPTKTPTGTFWPYTHNVTSTVTLDDPGTVTLVTTAYRHPATVRATITGADVVTISAPCRPTTLPTTWTVHVDGVKVGYPAVLKCR